MVIMYHNVFPPYKGERFTAVSKLFSVSCTLLWALPEDFPTCPVPRNPGHPSQLWIHPDTRASGAVSNPIPQWPPTRERQAITVEKESVCNDRVLISTRVPAVRPLCATHGLCVWSHTHSHRVFMLRTRTDSTHFPTGAKAEVCKHSRNDARVLWNGQYPNYVNQGTYEYKGRWWFQNKKGVNL